MQHDRVSMEGKFALNKNHQGLVLSSHQKKGNDRKPSLTIVGELVTDKTTQEYVKIAIIRADNLTDRRLEAQIVAIENITPIKEFMGLGPKVAKVEPVIRDGILCGPQEAPNTLYLPKAPYPFPDTNLLNCEEKIKAMQSIWDLTKNIKAIDYNKREKRELRRKGIEERNNEESTSVSSNSSDDEDSTSSTY